MATPLSPLFPKNMKQEIRVSIPASTFDEFFQLNPHHPTAIAIAKSVAVQIRVSITTKKIDGTPILDLEDTDMIWIEVTNDAIPYIEGDNKSLSGVRLTGTTASAIEVSITQF